jgi:hypothetical protein
VLDTGDRERKVDTIPAFRVMCVHYSNYDRNKDKVVICAMKGKTARKPIHLHMSARIFLTLSFFFFFGSTGV